MQMGIIYMLQSPSGKVYIGQTTRTLEKRLQEHCAGNGCVILHKAIKKYGIEHFNTQILVTCEDEKLDDYEIHYIQAYNSLEPNGYNIRTGGSAGKHSEASKERMRQQKLGVKNHNYGKPRSDQFKQIMSLKKSGAKHHFFGKKLTDDHKSKLAISHRLENDGLPMYLVKVRPRPGRSQQGYAICNHPVLKNKYFTHSKYTDDEKLKMALEYLQTSNGEGSTTKE
jgi:group I intron endonuclease